MFLQTEAVVLLQHKFGDSSSVFRVYTRERGMLSVVVKGLGSRKKRLQTALFMPLSLLELQLRRSSQVGLYYIHEVNLAEHYHSLHQDVLKTCVAAFLAEVLVKSLQQEEQETELFDFLKESLLYYDGCDKMYADFHLIFLMRLTKYLGFYPKWEDNFCAHHVFDMKEGVYRASYSTEDPESILSGHLACAWYQLMEKGKNADYTMFLPSSLRTELICTLLHYYKIHQAAFSEIKSFQVLYEVFHR